MENTYLAITQVIQQRSERGAVPIRGCSGECVGISMELRWQELPAGNQRKGHCDHRKYERLPAVTLQSMLPPLPIDTHAQLANAIGKVTATSCIIPALRPSNRSPRAKQHRTHSHPTPNFSHHQCRHGSYSPWYLLSEPRAFMPLLLPDPCHCGLLSFFLPPSRAFASAAAAATAAADLAVRACVSE